jgi:hypothetical protein
LERSLLYFSGKDFVWKGTLKRLIVSRLSDGMNAAYVPVLSRKDVG